MKRILLFIAILFSFGFSSYSQVEPCDPGEQYCNGGCFPAATCNRKNPPPPGLVVPIDTNIYFLLIAGFGLGVCFLGFQKMDTKLYTGSKIKK